LSGTNHILAPIAHQKLSKPTKQIHILFNCGGGIAGLSAARQFSKKEFMILVVELENQEEIHQVEKTSILNIR
jgi:heterodisulfide reductase subunit A-like polyferredoxin